MAVEIEQPIVLVVEGKEEEVFFQAFINHLRFEGIQILPIGGKEQLRPNLKALVASPGFSKVTSLGVVRDADANPDAAFQSVQDALKGAKLPTPERPLVPIGRSPRVAVMILPEGNAPGMLEDLCLKSVAQDPAMTCVEKYFQCLQKKVSLPDNLSKAKVQVFLASRPKAGLRLGEAAQAGYWLWKREAFQPLISFLNNLY